MCGIAGFSGSITKDSQRLLQDAARELLHRGPDNLGIVSRDHNGVAHTRLSILDLSEAGNQPFSDERFLLAYNGEIYNYLELREELQSKGIHVQGSSDTAVLFECLRHFGVQETLRKIRGMFAFSWSDLQEQTVWLCRDRFGIKPLYWTYCKETLYWASEVKALRRMIRIEPDPIRTLHAIASTGDASPSLTVFRGVRQVPPGCYLYRKKGREPEITTYFHLEEEIDENYYRLLDRASFKEAAEEFSALIFRSTKKMLMSDVPMGAFVSGGVDSALIAAVACKCDKDVHLVTADVRGRFSEAEDARRLAQALKVKLRECPFEPGDLIATLAAVTWHYECPVVTHSNAAPLARVAAGAREEGLKAVLTGEGSDELFLGYPGMAAAMFLPVLRAPVTFLERAYGLIPKLRKFVFPSQQPSAADFAHRATRQFEPESLKKRAEQAFAFLPPAERRWSAWSFVSMQSHLLTLLHRNDRMGMSASIEARFPYLDEDVVRFGLNLPRKHKVRWQAGWHDWRHPFLEDKAVVRAVARRYLPTELSQKRKQGFPLYGLQYLRIRPGFFRDGYVAQILEMDEKAEKAMIGLGDPYLVGKLAAVDVFGRLYGLNEGVTTVAQRLQEFCSMDGVAG
jgi:asparagine synthase (glutamine-hydrolysing)